MSEDVWDCEKFLKGEITDYPFEYDYAIIYRGCSEQIFFKKEFTASKRHEQVSVLQKGYLTAENGYKDRYSKEEVRSGSHAIAEPGVFCGFYETAESYARDIIIKIKVPVEALEVVAMPEEEIKKPEGRPKTFSLENSEQLDSIYGSPERMQFIAQKSMEVNSGGSRMDYIMFKVDQEVPLGTRKRPEDLQENWVEGVYDTNFSQQKVFEPLERYVRHLKAEKPEKLPEGITMDELKKEIRSEVRGLKKVLETVKDLHRLGNDIMSQIDSGQVSWKRLEADARKYRRGLEKLQKLLEEGYSIETGFSQPGKFYSDPERFKELFEGLEDELDEMIEAERSHFSSVADEGYSVEDYREESSLEKKIEDEIASEASRIPDLSQLPDSSRELFQA